MRSAPSEGRGRGSRCGQRRLTQEPTTKRPARPIAFAPIRQVDVFDVERAGDVPNNGAPWVLIHPGSFRQLPRLASSVTRPVTNGSTRVGALFTATMPLWARIGASRGT